ncbi:MAG: D-2-hydroxyacid dehydrogenase family protein [Beijerinckiaceae bacterium]|nr:D-2-hydroxyacid dehydrogenase family protein [Beijerinckiaceae bacterium]
MKTIAILDDYQSVALIMADWSRLDGRVKIKVLNRYIGDRNELAGELTDVSAIVCNRERTKVTAELIAALPKLELIVTSGMHNSSIDYAAADARGIPVCGTQTMGYPTAELTVAMMLGWCRHLPAEVASLKAGGWQTRLGIGVNGKTLGIVGYGRIGKLVAKAGIAMGMNVLALSRSLAPEKAAEDGVTAADLDTLLRNSDFVSIHLGVNPQSIGLFGAAEFAKMKKTALLINTARAIVVDQKAMVAALHAGEIGGAALDVYDIEPLPKDHPLMSAPNVLLSPHLGYVMEENYRVSFPQALENIEAWLAGEPKRLINH